MVSYKTPTGISGKLHYVAYSLTVKTDTIKHHFDGMTHQDSKRIEIPLFCYAQHHQGQDKIQETGHYCCDF